MRPAVFPAPGGVSREPFSRAGERVRRGWVSGHVGRDPIARPAEWTTTAARTSGVGRA